jgi:TPP-dependent 2-oxoacid decarboxylase
MNQRHMRKVIVMNTDTLQDVPFIPAPEITTVTGYLLTRLAEAGLISVFGVPGDYNLPILDAIAARPDLAWTGMATEQGAGYAADSYARQRGIGALVTTFGVGELSALNAIAGAYAESVPVVHIVGTPALAAREPGATLHHNLPGRDYDHFARMAAEVTAAQADLRAATAPEQIDRVLDIALRTSRPVYLTIPADVADLPVLAPTGPLPRSGSDAEPAVVAAFTGRARRMLAAADSASVLVGHLAARHRVTAQVRDLAAAGNLPVAVLSMAKGDFPESDPRFAGLYAGPASGKRARLAVEDTDVLITVGATLADTVTGGASPALPATRIELDADRARIGDAVYPGLGLRQSLGALVSAVGPKPARADLVGLPVTETATRDAGDRRLTQHDVWASVQHFLRPGDLLIADQGTAFYGAAELTLPDGARLAGQPLWASIGWALPAALGASLAAPDRRVVLIAGDGALQQTAAELGTLLGQGLAPVIIVLSNGGYATERAFGHPDAGYHDIPAWDWTALPAALAPAASAAALRACTAGELARALAAARHDTSAGRPVLIEVVLDAGDLPPLLRDLAPALRAPAHR